MMVLCCNFQFTRIALVFEAKNQSQYDFVALRNIRSEDVDCADSLCFISFKQKRIGMVTQKKFCHLHNNFDLSIDNYRSIS